MTLSVGRTGGNRIFALAVVSLVVIVLGSCGTERLTEAPPRYLRRELLLPDAAYRLPDVEAEILNPSPQLYVDPSRPLDPSLAREVDIDLVETVRAHYERVLEEQLEELLFD